MSTFLRSGGGRRAKDHRYQLPKGDREIFNFTITLIKFTITLIKNIIFTYVYVYHIRIPVYTFRRNCENVIFNLLNLSRDATRQTNPSRQELGNKPDRTRKADAGGRRRDTRTLRLRSPATIRRCFLHIRLFAVRRLFFSFTRC